MSTVEQGYDKIAGCPRSGRLAAWHRTAAGRGGQGRLAAAGFADMRLWVLDDNHRGRRFYAAAGLSPDGTRQTWTPRGSTVELPELRYATAL